MQHGDISNAVTGRFLLVFEGLVATLPDTKARAKFDAMKRIHAYKRAVGQFQINEIMGKVIWDTVWRRNHSVDVVTFLGDEFVEHVEARIEDWGLPVGRVWGEEKTMLARSLNYRPDVIAVYHANPSDFAMYGSKGVVLDPAHPTLIGGY